ISVLRNRDDHACEERRDAESVGEVEDENEPGEGREPARDELARRVAGGHPEGQSLIPPTAHPAMLSVGGTPPSSGPRRERCVAQAVSLRMRRSGCVAQGASLTPCRAVLLRVCRSGCVAQA